MVGLENAVLLAARFIVRFSVRRGVAAFETAVGFLYPFPFHLMEKGRLLRVALAEKRFFSVFDFLAQNVGKKIEMEPFSQSVLPSLNKPLILEETIA